MRRFKHRPAPAAFLALLWVLLAGGVCPAGAADALEVAPDQGPYHLSHHTGVLKDPGGRLTIEQVSSPPFAGQFQTLPGDFLRLGTQEGAVWLRLRLDFKPETTPADWVLELSRQFLDFIDIYLPNATGGWDLIQAGIARPLNSRMAVSRTPALQLPTDLPRQAVIYLRLQSHFGLGMHISLRDLREFHFHSLIDSYIYGLIYGAPLALALFNLFVFLSLRDRVYVYYVVFILSLLAYQLILHGQTHMLGLLLHETRLTLFGVMAGAALFFGTQFSRSFLLTSLNAPLWDKVLFAYMGLAVVRIGMSLVGLHTWGNHLAQIMGLLSPVLSITTGVVCWRRGFSPARYYIVAWTVLSLCVTWHVLVSFSLLPWTGVSSMMMGVGSALESILLSFALADRIRVLRRERESLAKATSHYRQLSNRDALTGLYNLRYFRDHLAPMVVEAQVRGEPLSLIMADIDDFKKFNDGHGHPEGDKVLEGMGQAIGHCVRHDDLPCRYGGEEFAIILPGASQEQGRTVAERIRQEFQELRFKPHGIVAPPVTVSLGLAALRSGESAEALLTRADQALYTAKDRGKNQTVVVA